MLCRVWRESYIGREGGSTEGVIGMQVRVLQVHDWQWMCQTQHAPGGGGKNMNLCSLFGEKYVRAILGLDEAMRLSRVVDVCRTPIIPKAQIWTFVFRCITWGITACRFQHYWDFLFFQPKKCSQHAGYKEHRGKKRNCVQCTLQLGKINTANCNVRSRGFRGIHLITLSHKPAGCVLFLPWVEILSHLKRAHSTAPMIKAVLLNRIVLCRALLCLNPKSKEALRNDLKRYCICTK